MNKKVKTTHSIIASIFRIFLSLRYKIIIADKTIIKNTDAKLFLPNHPALIDPIILTSHIYKYNNISPTILAKYYRSAIFRPILKLINAIPVADLSEGEIDRDVYKKLSKNAALCFSRGNHLLFYPAGQLSSGPEERLFNKQGAFRLVSELPENVRIIGVRINGLWGSSWSRAKTGKTPDFINIFFKGLGYLALRGFFFAPKRKIYYEFVDLSEELKALSKENRKAFNIFLEEFYNKNL